MPTGVVSKTYALVQHTAVVDAVREALEQVHDEPLAMQATLTLSSHGSRMALRVELPKDFAFEPPDGHRMILTFECFNSVDRTVPFSATLGWFRLVCSNGLMLGTTEELFRKLHRPSLQILDLPRVITVGLVDSTFDKKAMRASAQRRVSANALCRWVDGPVSYRWGLMAAARVLSIVTRGKDGEPSRTPRGGPASVRDIPHPRDVPGAVAPCDHAYGIAQALAWVAARRSEVAERLQWRRDIPELMAQLN